MSLSKEQIEQFEEAAKPLIKFLCSLPHPHFTAIVDGSSAEALEGMARIKCDEYIPD